MGIDELPNPDKANQGLWDWLNAEVDEGFVKPQLLKYCEEMDKVNQELSIEQGVKICQNCEPVKNECEDCRFGVVK